MPAAIPTYTNYRRCFRHMIPCLPKNFLRWSELRVGVALGNVNFAAAHAVVEKTRKTTCHHTCIQPPPLPAGDSTYYRQATGGWCAVHLNILTALWEIGMTFPLVQAYPQYYVWCHLWEEEKGRRKMRNTACLASCCTCLPCCLLMSSCSVSISFSPSLYLQV